MLKILQKFFILYGFTYIHPSSTEIVNTTCLTVPDNECHHNAFTTTKSACEGWICWESQLTLTNKRFIINTFNQYRNSVAQKSNIANMNKLVWHWTLEQEAIMASATCQRKYLELYEERRDIPGLGYSMLCENGCMYREDMVLPSQTLFKQLLYSFLKENGLQQYDEDDNYRRGNTRFTGCSLVVIRAVIDNSYQNIFIFVCVFCTGDAKLETIRSNSTTEHKCSPPGIFGADKRYSNLCTDKNLRNIFLCEPENPCPEDPKTEIWRSEFEGRVSRLSLLQTTIGPLLLVNESVTQVNRLGDSTLTSVTTPKIYVDTEGSFQPHLHSYPPVPRSIYFYSQHQAAIYNKTLHSVARPNVSYIYLEDPGVCEVTTPSPAIEGTTDAFCCFYLMLATVLTTIVLGGLLVYTAIDYRKKIQ